MSSDSTDFVKLVVNWKKSQHSDLITLASRQRNQTNQLKKKERTHGQGSQNYTNQTTLKYKKLLKLQETFIKRK